MGFMRATIRATSFRESIKMRTFSLLVMSLWGVNVLYFHSVVTRQEPPLVSPIPGLVSGVKILEPWSRPVEVCNPSVCRTIPPMLTLATNESIHEFQRKMRVAWGHPPRIDLYVRAGCDSLAYLHYLWETVYLFWPTFFGIIVVLDEPDRHQMDLFIPQRLREMYAVKVIFEPCPCMSGRIFNQYSYLNLDRYSTAEYVVTIDSDCAFHTPVIPDLLFRDGKLILPTSLFFQYSLPWNQLQQFFTQKDFHPLGHSMITQPVNFHVSTFSAYRDWIKVQNNGTSLEDRIVELLQSRLNKYWFCWMCQLKTYIVETPTVSAYNVLFVDSSKDIYQRYAVHVKHELKRDYHGTVELLIKESECRFLADPPCAHDYMRFVTFRYDRKVLNRNTTQEERSNVYHTTTEYIRNL
jgi:hypothetical protein